MAMPVGLPGTGKQLRKMPLEENPIHATTEVENCILRFVPRDAAGGIKKEANYHG